MSRYWFAKEAIYVTTITVTVNITCQRGTSYHGNDYCECMYDVRVRTAVILE